jgi:hypothetical protein
MDIASVVSSVTENYDTILAVIGALVTAATAIVALTPTPKDDAILAKVIKVLDFLSVINPKGTKVVKTDKKPSQADVKTEVKIEVVEK